MKFLQNRLFFIGVLVVVLLLGCSVQIATAEEGYQFVTKWWGSPDGPFWEPSGVAVDNAGNVYVADTRNNRIQKFTSTGIFITMWGTGGAGNGQFNWPWGIAVDSGGNVYIADTGNNRIQKFTSTGTFVTKWGGLGTGAGQFHAPLGIAVDSVGYVYVVDSSNNRVQKFTSTGTFVAKWGVLGSENGQFTVPMGIAADSVGNIYVTDFNNDRVQKFTTIGTFLMTWGSKAAGEGCPYGVAVDNAGNVYVVGGDTSRGWVKKWTSTGTVITTCGDDRFNTPRGVAIDNAGNVYVADTVHNLIQKFAPISPISTTSTFRFTPSPLTIKRGSTNTTTLYIDGLKNGISGFNVSLSLSLTDPTIGEIVGVSLPGWTMQQKSTLPADTVWLSAIDTAGISEPGASSAQIGTITIRGDRNGQTALSIIQARVDDDSGELTSPQFANCPVEVTGSGLYLSCIQSYPNDLNEDGRYEDINGNGHIDFNDVVLFFNNMDWIAANEPVSAFDFNRNGQVDFNDVVWLFNQI
jgi:DNA-binding beta-propeller fold protein YncE